VAFRILKVCELALEATMAGHKPWELSLRLATSPPPQAGDVVLLCPTMQATGTWPVRGTARVLRVEPIALHGSAPPHLTSTLCPELRSFCQHLWSKWLSQACPPARAHITWLTDIRSITPTVDIAAFASVLPHPRTCNQLPAICAPHHALRQLRELIGALPAAGAA
jgi:hypothetical protein